MTTTAHAPLRHAADQALRKFANVSIENWMAALGETPAQMAAIKLANDTQGIIVVDRRTVARWRDELAQG